MGMAALPNVTVSALDAENTTKEPKVIDHTLLAKMHIREGKPFTECALAAGYTHSTALKGLRYLMAASLPLTEAIRKEWEAMSIDVTRLKPVAVSRLYREIAAPDSPNAMKAIELAGRFRETDWFVRNTEVQLGIFMGMTDHVPDVSEPDKFKE